MNQSVSIAARPATPNDIDDARLFLQVTSAVPAWVRQTYRRRSGIETSYRQMHQARIRTSSRRPLLRLLFVGLALILRNACVWFHLTLLARPRDRHLQLSN